MMRKLAFLNQFDKRRGLLRAQRLFDFAGERPEVVYEILPVNQTGWKRFGPPGHIAP